MASNKGSEANDDAKSDNQEEKDVDTCNSPQLNPDATAPSRDTANVVLTEVNLSENANLGTDSAVNNIKIIHDEFVAEREMRSISLNDINTNRKNSPISPEIIQEATIEPTQVFKPVSHKDKQSTDKNIESHYPDEQNIDSHKQNNLLPHSNTKTIADSSENPDVLRFHNLCLQSSAACSDDANVSNPKNESFSDDLLQFLVTEDVSGIKNPELLKLFFVEYVRRLSPKVISQVLSVLIAIIKKSVFHLESTRGLILPSVKYLTHSTETSIENKQQSIQSSDPSNMNQDDTSDVSLTRHFMREWINLLIAHSCDVDELQYLIKLSETESSLLEFIQQAHSKQRNAPSSFFAFPGTKGSMISLPPFHKWPNQLGWSFSTWFFLEPKPFTQPYLYNFKTGKSSLGYSAHFTGNCLVLTSIRVKGKGVQHCIAYEFPSYKWIHCAITYHNKWRASEVKVYVNGQLTANIDMPWQVQTTESYDKCFIGGSGLISRNDGIGDLSCFCGLMSAVYLFNEGLSPAQICALHRLGPSYMGQYKYSNESCVNLPPQICKTLYEEKLASSLFCSFTPVAVDSGTLCIQLASFKSSTSTSAQNYFVSAPHAALTGGTRAIITQSICSTLQSVGCSKVLLPLLQAYSIGCQPKACANLISFLCDLMETSPHWFANEIVQNNVFVIVARSLSINPRLLLTDRMVDIFLNLTRTLLSSATSSVESILLKHIMDNILFNPSLWIYSEPKVQLKLYHYLAFEFLSGKLHGNNRYSASSVTNSAPYLAYNPTSHATLTTYGGTYSNAATIPIDEQIKDSSSVVADLLFGEIRRVSTVLQILHTLKYYYWIDSDCNINHKARTQRLRPNREELVTIRSHLLRFMQELIIRSNTTPMDEVQGLLNYLSACSKPANIIDVMDTLSQLISQNPSPMIAALEQKQGIKVLFTLIGSCDERVSIEALRLLTRFLSHCSYKKKQDIMGPCNLFMLLCDRLRIHLPLSLHLYEALIDLLIEETEEHRKLDEHRPIELSRKSIVNSTVIKVIASLIHDQRTMTHESTPSQTVPGAIDIRDLFIADMWNIIVNSRDNRRIILQMSVWQHWLVNLIGSTIDESPLTKDRVLAIFRVLLYHAIRYEYGGWRVWIDTLAIIHAKVSYDDFCHITNPEPSKVSGEKQTENSDMKPSSQAELKPDSSENHTEVTESKDRVDDENLELNKGQITSVNSISKLIIDTSRGIDMTDDIEQEIDSRKALDVPDTNPSVADSNLTSQESPQEPLNSPTISEIERSGTDSVDLAPSRAYRQTVVEPEQEQVNGVEPNELTRQQSVQSIPLNDSPTPSKSTELTKQDTPGEESLEQPKTDNNLNEASIEDVPRMIKRTTASPAFRVPEFKWSGMLLKLLNDLVFSIECDLYQWRCNARLASLDAPPFSPKTALINNNNSTNQTVAGGPSAPKTQMESILQRPENQIYIMNVIHLISQLADNVIIASGGLLPLLAEATGGNRGTSTPSPSNPSLTPTINEGLTIPQANSILYRLVVMVDMVVFAASHINLSELEADKNTTNGGILRQCLRLACTVTVKNCLVLRSLQRKLSATEDEIKTPVDFPRDMFDSYLGCSLLSANGLFGQSALDLDETDLIANLEYSPHQNPNTSSMPSFLPFQTSPIKDPQKLLQWVDIQRIQACIYHNSSTESRQSQFLALSSLYFISVLMVSKYRDIIEPKNKSLPNKSVNERGSPASTDHINNTKREDDATTSLPVSSIEANLLDFGRMQPNNTSSQSQQQNNSLTYILTAKLENTLDTVCPLLKAIMCDFCPFLAKTLLGSHGQDLVNKEAERTFKRLNASPVEVVMLLCSQEWQNTLQKNAGLAFIELINEGRVLSHGMKDHIVRVAMEADFILRRLRADDVAKHEQFGLACSESLSARLHEELLINSLIGSAARRDYVTYCKFKDNLRKENQRNYRLDIWEDDDRRKRRYVFDTWDDSTQIFYSPSSVTNDEDSKNSPDKTDTRRMMELQESLELGGIHEQCSASGSRLRSVSFCDSEADIYEEEDEDTADGRISSSPHSEKKYTTNSNIESSTETEKQHRTHNAFQQHAIQRVDDKTDAMDANNEYNRGDLTNWDFDECSSVNDFTGSVIFATEAHFIWSIYAIPGVLQITTHELHFEPNQNIIDAIDSLSREGKQIDSTSQCPYSSETDQAGLKLIKSTLKGDTSLNSEQISLRRIDLKALRYCDFLTNNGKILINDVRAIFSRHYLLQPNALEVFLSQRTSVMFAFADFDVVKRIVKYLPPVGVGIKYGIPQSRRASLMSPKQLFAASNMTQRWQKREISNFQYLMFMNTIAGRTYQDLNQYPVFPWILTDYESEHLDLNLPKNFRDLSKPVGALNSKRRSEFIDRYQNWDNPKIPAFHYGTHYSTAAFTLNWLCRLRGAYNTSYLALEDGKYEENTRLFLSVGDSWVSSLSGGHQNVKELIPEFFYLPEMFHANLGLPEVEYPPWAKSAEQFVRMHRAALESELVSCQLHQWIDLIFGYKQRGSEAVNAVNTFYYLTYQENVNLSQVQDHSLREAIETQIKHFGQTPSQLLNEPHPPRFSALHASPLIYSTEADEVNKVLKFPFSNPIIHISACLNEYQLGIDSSSDTNSTETTLGKQYPGSPSCVVTITANNQYQVHKWTGDDQSGHPIVIDHQLDSTSGTGTHLVRRQLIDVEDVCTAITLKLVNHDEPASTLYNETVEEVHWPCTHHVVTLNGRYIIMGSFYDNSFRVFTTESGKLCQVIYGHRGFITCIARSEGNAAADFYLATGGQDCALLVWVWNERYAQVEGSGVSAVQNPLPKLSICGHKSAILSVTICSELGLIISGSKSLVLVHTLTSGENLLQIDMQLPEIMRKTLEESKIMHQLVADSSASIVQRPQVRDKLKTILEASMLGDRGHPKSSDHEEPSNRSHSETSRAQSPMRQAKEERFSQLQDLCCSDYYITGLKFAREPAFIVCVALPPPRRKCKNAPSSEDDRTLLRSPPALLLTFNLKGSLIDSTTIGHSSVSSPKLGDPCSLQVSKDGEYLVLNDSPITIKIYRTFGLQPLYAYNTNDVPNVVSEEQNRVRSLALLDQRYILVGLDNGRLIVYNCDFKKL